MASPVASGILFLHNRRVLLLRRREGVDAAGCWAFPGGKIEAGETPRMAARREVWEETGILYVGDLLDLGVASNGFQAFAAALPTAHVPALNDEHTAYEWAAFDHLPAPLHPEMVRLLQTYKQ
jgi:8-oxo-dGTP pyrophosphatase MutT (NUDIX family)